METTPNPNDVILKLIDHIVKENNLFLDELKHINQLTELGIPSADDIQIRMAIMQTKMEVYAGIMNLLAPFYGGIQIVLPHNLKLFNNENETDEQK